MGYSQGKSKTAAAKKPRDHLYVGCFRALITDDPRLPPETPEEAQERQQSAWFRRWRERGGLEGFRQTVQFFRGEGVDGIDFAPMTVKGFSEFTLSKAWKYRFVGERDGYGYEVVKLYRRPAKQPEEKKQDGEN
jgi:hypothetical protein